MNVESLSRLKIEVSQLLGEVRGLKHTNISFFCLGRGKVNDTNSTLSAVFFWMSSLRD